MLLRATTSWQSALRDIPAITRSDSYRLTPDLRPPSPQDNSSARCPDIPIKDATPNTERK